jgi:hypothetical protein
LPVQKYTYWQEPVQYVEVVAALGVLARGGKSSLLLLSLLALLVQTYAL